MAGAGGALRPARRGDRHRLGKEALEAVAPEVPFYGGITAEEIGGLGVRWQDRTRPELPAGSGDGLEPEPHSDVGTAGGLPGRTRSRRTAAPGSATYRDLWAAEVTDRSPALRFLAPEQTIELAPHDAERLGIGGGDEVDVRSNGTSVRARVVIRERVRPGAGFLIEGLGDNCAGALVGEDVEVSRREATSEPRRSPTPTSPRRPGS